MKLAEIIKQQREFIRALASQGESGRAALRRYAKRNPQIAEDVTRALAEVHLETTLPRKQDVVTLYFDGACEPKNPGGLISWGWFLEANGGEMIGSDCGVDDRVGPDNTNNVAEYMGLIAGLEAALEGEVSHLHVRGDSRLVIKQMGGAWGCHSERLRALYERAWDLRDGFEQIGFEWIPRERNAQADELARLALEDAAAILEW